MGSGDRHDPERDEPNGSPPPDPSMRPWRHPSEVAAAAAAAARDAEAEGRSRRRWSTWSFTIGGATGAAVVLGVVALASFSLTDAGDSDRFSLRAPGVGPSISAIETSPTTGGTGEATTTITTASITTATIATASTTTASMAASMSTAASTVASTSAHELTIDGILEVHTADGERRLANALVVDGLILTSATAIGDETQFLLTFSSDHTGDGSPLNAELVGRDQFTDLAVLAPNEAAVELATVNTLPDERAVQPGSPVKLMATDGEPEPIAVLGELVSHDQRSMTKAGHHVIGALITSVRLPDLAAGAALMDGNGNAIGMIIDSSGYLAHAVPLREAAAIGHSLVVNGWPSGAWLGIEGADTAAGVRLTSVSDDGPASSAGLQPDDVVATVDGKGPADLADLVHHLRSMHEGDWVTLGITRGNDYWTVDLEIEFKPSAK